ncbi:MAG: tetratricopeptide repeat protein [Candidatus Altiarchaeota archaeon]
MVRTTVKQKISLLLFSIFLTLLIIEFSLRLGGYIVLSLQRYGNRTGSIVDEPDDTYRILALGESTTANLLNGQSTWPEQLELILNNRSQNTKFTVYNEGLAGATTVYILSHLERNLEEYKPDMVITMMGVNDILFGMNVLYEHTPEAKITLLVREFRVYKLGKWISSSLRSTPDKEERSDLAGLGVMYLLQERYEDAEEMFDKSIDLNPNDEGSYAGLMVLYCKQDRLDDAEYMFKRGLEMNPNNELVYLGLQLYFCKHGSPNDAERMFKKAIELNPSSGLNYVVLCSFYYDRQRLEDAERILKMHIELNPENASGYVWLGAFYAYKSRLMDAEDMFLAEEMFLRAIELNPTPEAYAGLGTIYLSQNRLDDAEKMFFKVINSDLEPNNQAYNTAYLGFLRILSIRDVSNEKSKEYLQRRGIFSKTQEEYTTRELTEYHYQNLHEMLQNRGIVHIVMQYPLKEIDDRKMRFEGYDDILFVSNEANFKGALENASYDDYFIDRFAGDFGHCTLKGNRLIAENLADVILSETVF